MQDETRLEVLAGKIQHILNEKPSLESKYRQLAGCYLLLGEMIVDCYRLLPNKPQADESGRVVGEGKLAL